MMMIWGEGVDDKEGVGVQNEQYSADIICEWSFIDKIEQVVLCVMIRNWDYWQTSLI